MAHSQKSGAHQQKQVRTAGSSIRLRPLPFWAVFMGDASSHNNTAVHLGPTSNLIRPECSPALCFFFGPFLPIGFLCDVGRR